MDGLKHVFTPVTVKSVTVRNRIVLPPMNFNYGSKEGFVTERLIAFYQKVAEGGTGLVQIGACAISLDSIVTTNQIRADDDKYIEGISALFKAIKEAGAVSSIQLVHPGKLIHSPKPAPEAGPFPPGPILPIKARSWNREELIEARNAFALAAFRVKQAGADMITIHGAHHYLLNELMSPYFNERTDEYGGDLSNRVRFSKEVIREIRKKVGADFPIIFRISGSDFLEGGLSSKDVKEIVPLLIEAGADIIDVSAGGRVTYGSKEDRTFPSRKLGPACNVSLACGIKEISTVPVICVGNIWSLGQAEEILANKKSDMVAMGRALIADPALVRKTQAGDMSSIVACTHCNKCLYFIHGKQNVSCPMNKNL
jgi:2,4-dienoyl-CoA reductase-like NADH-dependent reductase (Old Yellow Enzyme family)